MITRRQFAAQTLAATAVLAQQPPVRLRGAGATFPAPLYRKWFESYQAAVITYEATGSQEGLRQLAADQVDFAATDFPGVADERFRLFPSVAGAVVPIVNLPNVTAEVAFTSEILADIYLGKIRYWDDPQLKRANPKLRLPHLAVTPITRADGSGTSYAFTDYLSRTSAAWKSAVGVGMLPQWPAGTAAKNGSAGVSAIVRETPGSIGYVEFIYALENHLSFGRVRNAHGEWVAASLETIGAAVATGQLGDDFRGSIADAPGANAYPIASFTWLVVPATVPAAKRDALTSFLLWMAGPGQRQAAGLGYVALPAALASRVQSAIALIR